MQVSVVIPSYNDAPRLAQALASVQAQTFTDWEAIIIDDGSRDQHAIAQVVADCEDRRIRLCLSARNRGAARSRNIGVRLARGGYIAFLDCDDLWEPGKLAAQLAFMVRGRHVLCCTAYRNLDEDSGQTSLRTPPPLITYDALLGHNSIGCSTVMLDRKALGRSYFPDIRMRQDFAHWLLILRAGHKAAGMPDVLTIRRTYQGSLSANKRRAAWYTWRMYRDVIELDPLTAARHFARYAIRGLLDR